MERFHNDPFFQEVNPPSIPLLAQRGLGNGSRGPAQSYDHHRSLELSPFGGIGMGLMPFAGPSPFSMMNNMMRNMDNMMRNMQRQAEGGQCFSSSSTTVMHYSSGGGGEQPQVYHATTSTRQGPGGVKETRKAVRDSHTGVQKMAVGHHIGDRSHVIERRVNAKTGERAQNQEFINLDDTDAEAFDEEWREKTHHLNRASYLPSIHHRQLTERRGLPSSTQPQNPTHPHRVDGDEPSVSGMRRENGGKRKHRPVSLSGEEGEPGGGIHTGATSRRSPKLIRTKSPPYTPEPTTSQPRPQPHPQPHFEPGAASTNAHKTKKPKKTATFAV